MKVQGSLKRSQTIEGQITVEDLLALVRQTVHIPDGSATTFRVVDQGRHSGYNVQTQVAGGMLSPIVHIGASNPISFTITWTLPDAKEQG